MKKKALQIIIILVIIIVIGFLAVKFLNKKSASPMEGKSLMDIAKEQGEEAPSKEEAVSKCEESQNQQEKDTCYNIGAFYYRDVDLCKNIKDLGIKEGCTEGKIEKYYESLEKGIPGEDTPVGLPSTLEIAEKGTEGETSGGEENNPIMYKNIEDISSKEMIKYCQQQINEMVIETPIYLKDSCFYQIAIHFRNPELCNNIDIANTKEKCLESVGDFSKEWDAMQGKIGKMNEALYVEIGVWQYCGTSETTAPDTNLEGMEPMEALEAMEAYQKWLGEWPERLNNKFDVTMEEYELYLKVIEQDELSAMNLGIRVFDQAHETCPN